MKRITCGTFVAQVAWPRVEAELKAGALALLPVGAACKEHGRHLPMNTDLLQAEWLATKITRHAHVVVWPTVAYGHYPAFVDFPGSCSLSSETFTALVREIVNDILRSGARTVIILNTGISTITPLRALLDNDFLADDVKLINVYHGPNFRRAATALEEQPRGGHADEIETSVMLAVAPQVVALDRAERWSHRPFQPGAFSRADPTNPNYTPSGANGDPTLATKAKGRALLEAMLQDILEQL